MSQPEKERAESAAQIQAFYDQHPYPPPVEDLDRYQQRWQDENRRRADFHLHWPARTYRTDLSVLVAGCGTSQAARHALRQPDSHVVGIDLSAASLQHTLELKRKYQLDNLEVVQLPIERAAELGQRFDKIVCTGVLHHLPDPLAGLRALQEVLRPDGVLNLMVYARYGRIGVYLLQEYCRRLGVGDTEREIQDLANTLLALPQDHPLAPLLGGSPDFRTKAGLADALLHPQDRAYSVPELFDLLAEGGLIFGRWLRQAPYLPQCGALADTPHAPRLAQLPLAEQYAAVELFRGNMLRHSLIASHQDFKGNLPMPDFDADRWLDYTPLRLPETINVKKRLPPGAAAVLINQNHSHPDLALPVSAEELRLVEAVDGQRSIQAILKQVENLSASSTQQLQSQARRLFERLWWYDQVVFAVNQPG